MRVCSDVSAALCVADAALLVGNDVVCPAMLTLSHIVVSPGTVVRASSLLCYVDCTGVHRGVWCASCIEYGEIGLYGVTSLCLHMPSTESAMLC